MNRDKRQLLVNIPPYMNKHMSKKSQEFVKRIPKKQRALILQGGGALGAYEVGVFRAIYDKITREEGEDNALGNLFDIVAGASIGAINAALLVNFFLNNRNWRDSPGNLQHFWNKLTAQTWASIFLNNILLRNFWGFMRVLTNNYIASFESLRRYLSWRELAYVPFLGSPNLSWTMPVYGSKFLDPFKSFSLRYDFSPLEDLLRESINQLPIQTSFDKEEPRLLLVSVDVQDCTTAVTFDSYQKFKPPTVKDKTITGSVSKSDTRQWYSEYGDENNKHIVFHQGIGLEQVLASCLFPYSSRHVTMKDEVSGTFRTYWDGAFLSNTPLREVIQHHKDFWLSYFKEKGIEHDELGLEKEYDDPSSKYQTTDKKRVPSLEVYIINLYPSIEKGSSPPKDDDLIDDRMNDIRFHDKTVYDEKVAHMTSDYIDMARELIKRLNAAKAQISQRRATKTKAEKGLLNELEKLLDPGEVLKMLARTVSRNNEERTYKKLLEGRFDIRVCRIDREDDKDTISGKHSDFSSWTIKTLMDSGERDAIRSFKHCKS
jgi:NTE family protein